MSPASPLASTLELAHGRVGRWVAWAVLTVVLTVGRHTLAVSFGGIDMIHARALHARCTVHGGLKSRARAPHTPCALRVETFHVSVVGDKLHLFFIQLYSVEMFTF